MDPTTADKDFNWALVRSFLAVLDAGSLMGAARQLGAQQPTLGRHVAELEVQLGGALFERTGRGVVPTALALAIAEPARQMQAHADTLARTLQRTRQATTGSVRVTTSEVAAAYLLPPLLARLQRAEPGIDVVLVANNQISNLLRREADIALRMVRPAQPSLVARKLGDVPVVVCAHSSYLQRAGPLQVPTDLLRHRLIGYDRDPTIQRGVAALAPDLPALRFVVRTDNQLAYAHLVAAGAGVGFMARYQQRQLPGVQVLLPTLAIPPLPCWLAVHREIRSSALVRRVFDFLAAEVPAALAS